MNPYYDAYSHIGHAKVKLLAAQYSLESIELARVRFPENSNYWSPQILQDIYSGCLNAAIAILGAVRDDTCDEVHILDKFSGIVRDSAIFSEETCEIIFKVYSIWKLAKSDSLELKEELDSDFEPNFGELVSQAGYFIEASSKWLDDFFCNKSDLKLKAKPYLNIRIADDKDEIKRLLIITEATKQKRAELLSV